MLLHAHGVHNYHWRKIKTTWDSLIESIYFPVNHLFIYPSFTEITFIFIGSRNKNWQSARNFFKIRASKKISAKNNFSLSGIDCTTSGILNREVIKNLLLMGYLFKLQLINSLNIAFKEASLLWWWKGKH